MIVISDGRSRLTMETSLRHVLCFACDRRLGGDGHLTKAMVAK